MNSRRLAICLWLIFGPVWPSWAFGLDASPRVPARWALAADPSPLLLDDVAEPLAPKHSATEADRDRVEAAALFAAGRTHELREQYAESLRCYERAWRCDPESSAIIQAIIPVAIQLDRCAEGARYAQKAVALEGVDSLQLRRLAVCLTEEDDWAGAAAVYEKVLAARGHGKQTALDVMLRMEAARIYLMAAKPKQAAECFAQVLDALDHPDKFNLDARVKDILLDKPGATHQLIGDCFLAADRPADAKAAFEKAEKATPDKALRQYNVARVCLKMGKPAESLAALESALAGRLAVANTAPYETLAEALSKLGKKAELIGRLEKLRAVRPDDPFLDGFLARQYVAAGSPDKAEPVYRKCFEALPTAGVLLELADVYQRVKQYDALLTLLGAGVERFGALEMHEQVVRRLSLQPEASRAILKAAHRRAMSSSEIVGYGPCVAAAMLAMEAKQYEQADLFFNLVVGAKPKQAADLFILWGRDLVAAERFAEAAKVFRRAIDAKALPDNDPRFQFYLAGALTLGGRTDEALAVAQATAEKAKASAHFRALFRSRPAWVLAAAQRNGEAIAAYRAVLGEFDADDSAETRDALREDRLALSNLCVLQGDSAAAEEWLEQVLDEFPDDPAAMNDLGYLWADANKHLRRARRMVQAAVDAQPDNRAYRDSLGWVLFRLGDYPRAVAELEKAAADKKPDGTVLDHLGDAYRKIGRPDKAAETWRRAVEVFRKEKESKKAEDVEQKIAGSAK
jgi:tetratricopeptide (TPR) repeat protein